jgi:hypothetical protein
MEKLFDLKNAVLKEKGVGTLLRITETLDNIQNACGNFSAELLHLKAIVDRYKAKNSRMFVNLKNLFTFFSKKNELINQ